jgi:hypothetical protein
VELGSGDKNYFDLFLRDLGVEMFGEKVGGECTSRTASNYDYLG